MTIASFESPTHTTGDLRDPESIRQMFVRWLSPSCVESAYEIGEIEGRIPHELRGTLYRNGPSQQMQPPQGSDALHLFDGDGLVHAFRFEDGRAFYRSSLVRNPSFLAEQAEGRFCMGAAGVRCQDPIEMGRVQPNTNIVLHAGRLFALVENAPPFELDPETLAPIGGYDFDDRMLGLSTTAHPKIDGDTGQMVIHGYQPVEPFMSLYVVEPDGRVSLAETMDAPWPGMMHDLAITQDHVILPLAPVHFDVGVLAEGGTLHDALSWQPERGLKLGVRSREAGASIRWFDAPTPGFIFHPGNAYEVDGTIFMDAVTYPDGRGLLDDLASVRRGELGGGLCGHPMLYELDLATGSCRERRLSDRPAEFPRIDDRLIGRRNRFGYVATSRPDPVSLPDATFTGLLKYDRSGGPSSEHALPAAHWCGESVFVPRSPDSGEDEGFLLVQVYDGPNDRSCLLILDARDLAAEPLAKLWVRERMPLGFHGNFVPATS